MKKLLILILITLIFILTAYTAVKGVQIGNFVIFSKELAKAPLLKNGDLIMVNGRVSKRFAEYQVNINNIQILQK